MNNYRVYFVNENIEVQAAGDTTLLEAQILAGLHPDAPCGGKGTCGKCLVEVRESGKGEWKQLLACQEKVHCDLEVRTAAPSGSVKILTQADAEDTAAWDPWIRVVRAELPSGCTQEQVKAIAEKAAGITEWAQGVEIAAYEGDAVWAIAAPDKILAVSYSEPNAFMAAFDIGTTTIAGYLISLKQKKVAAVASMLNPQIQFGADVISRANYTLEHGVGELTENIRGALDGLIGQMCLQAKAARSDVYAVSAVGNTCMHHLLIGVELHTLVRAPYDPAVRGEMILSAREYGMDVHPCAQLLLQPVIAGFVGADTVACLVSGKWRERKPCTLLIDIGTNG
ncbi:MAG: 2Fe-2S iron-sulfur cluster binding domain-containing protein, partial [Clostridia bacterium]|nr:2Fe-2S iron-sulfur cluster binding domain-containing protein [Clostridia bacterium]